MLYECSFKSTSCCHAPEILPTTLLNNWCLIQNRCSSVREQAPKITVLLCGCSNARLKLPALHFNRSLHLIVTSDSPYSTKMCWNHTYELVISWQKYIRPQRHQISKNIYVYMTKLIRVHLINTVDVCSKFQWKLSYIWWDIRVKNCQPHGGTRGSLEPAGSVSGWETYRTYLCWGDIPVTLPSPEPWSYLG